MFRPSHLHNSRRGSTISIRKKSSLSTQTQELLATKGLLILPKQPPPISGSGLMEDPVAHYKDQPADDSQATTLNNVDGSDDASGLSSDNFEGGQDNSGFVDEDEVGSIIEDTAVAEDEWECSPPSEMHQQQQLATTSQANHLRQQQQHATASQANHIRQQQQQHATTSQANHIRQQQQHATTSLVGCNVPWQQQQQIATYNNNATSQQRPQLLPRTSSSNSSSSNQIIRPLLSTNNNLLNLPLSSSTIPEWEGCNPDVVIKRLKAISKDDLLVSGKRDFYKSYSLWEKMTVEQRNKSISWFRSLPEHLQGLLEFLFLFCFGKCLLTFLLCILIYQKDLFLRQKMMCS